MSANPQLTGTCDRTDVLPQIEMKDITKIFHTAAGEFCALKNVTACFYPGEFVSIVGKSGSGKSTLANMLTGIDHPTSGAVCIGDTCVHDMNESKMSVWRGRNLGIVFQFFQLLPTLTLLENVMLPMDLNDVFPWSERESRATELLRMVGLEEHADELPAQVSGGQQQSAAVARALANDPPIIVADEPTGNLDSKTADAVFEIFAELARQDKTVIMVTHDTRLAERADRFLLLSDGEVINDLIVAGFPGVTRRRMLWLSHHLVRRRYGPGEILPDPGAGEIGLYLVSSGEIEVLRETPTGAPETIDRLGPGETLNTLDLRAAGRHLLSLRAAGAVECLALLPGAFDRWLDESERFQAEMEKNARQRAKAWRDEPAPIAEELP